MSRTSRRPCGFTLIELLVVIAIIAILASLLMPALENARASALKVGCINNMRTLSIGLVSYTSEYKGRLPFAWCSPYDTVVYGDTWWPYGGGNPCTMIYPQVDNINPFMCPAFRFLPGMMWEAGPTGPAKPYVAAFGPNGVQALRLSQYKPNPYLGCQGYGAGSYPAWNLAVAGPPVPQWSMDRLRGLSAKVFLVDGLRTRCPYGSSPQLAASPGYWMNSTGDNDRSNPYDYSPAGGWYNAPNMGVWHQKGTNVLFLDSHVEWQARTSVKTFYDLTDTYWKLP